MPSWWAYAVAAGYGTALLAIHLIATKGTWDLPAHLKQWVGSDAGSILTRPWALFTSQFFHNHRFHVLYNITIMMATLPFAIQTHGVRTLAAIVVASMIAVAAVNLMLVLPLHTVWDHASAVLHGRLVGASVAIFAGAGIAWTVWNGPLWAKALALLGFVTYEVILGITGRTSEFVAIYHLAGTAVGIGMGKALQLLNSQ